MGIVIFHDDHGANVHPQPDGNVHITFRDVGFDQINVYPMTKEAALQFAEKIKQRATGVVIPGEGQ